MAKSHNKKRNIGLLYELLVAQVSNALVDGNKKRSAQALKLIKRHFKPGTELYKEFRLVNSLVKTTVSSPGIAAGILHEAKNAARSHDVNELNRQKSLLIRDINHIINDVDFYDQQVGRYRTLATIQTLINDWRDPSPDLSRMAQYEDQLCTWLTTTEKEQPTGNGLLTEETPGTNRLMMKVMVRKLNEKYAAVLNDDQKALVRAYAFSTANADPNSIRLKLIEVRDRLVASMDAFTKAEPENSYINVKLVEARALLIGEQLDVVDDDVVTRFMLYTKLAAELEGDEVS